LAAVVDAPDDAGAGAGAGVLADAAAKALAAAAAPADRGDTAAAWAANNPVEVGVVSTLLSRDRSRFVSSSIFLIISYSYHIHHVIMSFHIVRNEGTYWGMSDKSVVWYLIFFA
jgi:nucleoid-associated protein YgaU